MRMTISTFYQTMDKKTNIAYDKRSTGKLGRVPRTR